MHRFKECFAGLESRAVRSSKRGLAAAAATFVATSPRSTSRLAHEVLGTAAPAERDDVSRDVAEPTADDGHSGGLAEPRRSEWRWSSRGEWEWWF